jgi:FkbM family methyltransferase
MIVLKEHSINAYKLTFKGTGMEKSRDIIFTKLIRPATYWLMFLLHGSFVQDQKLRYKSMYSYPDIAGKHALLFGCWEGWNIDAAVNLAKERVGNQNLGCFLDIGANLGVYSVNLAEHFEKTYAFEPAVIARHVLQANVLSNKLGHSIEVVELGLSNDKTTLEFFVDPANSGMSSLVKSPTNADFEKTMIDLVRGDDFLKDKNSHKVSFMKVDVENHEFEVLQGLTNTIERDKPLIQLELDGASEIAKKIDSYLKDLGYTQKLVLKDTYFTKFLRKFFGIYPSPVEIDVLEKRFYQAVWYT